MRLLPYYFLAYVFIPLRGRFQPSSVIPFYAVQYRTKKAPRREKFSLLSLNASMVYNEFLSFLLCYAAVFSILLDLIRKNLNICPHFDTTDFLYQNQNTLLIFLQNIFQFLRPFFAKRFKVKKLAIYCIARNRSWLLVIFPGPKIIFLKYQVLHSPVKYEISISGPGWSDDPSRLRQ
jgi:hypothetical protein